MCRGYAARHGMVVVASGHEGVCRGQDRQRNARVAHQRNGVGESGGRQHRQLRHMTDSHASLHATGDGLARDPIKVPPACVEVEIRVKVEIDVELAHHGEATLDLACGIRVGVWATA